MTDLAVVHLARHANGWEPFERFLRSYEEHPAGVDHDLVVALKGHPGPDPPVDYVQRAAAVGAAILQLDDTGFDLGSYRAAADALPYPTLCFLNSFSVILEDGWLAKLQHHHGPEVGLVGASGSWESHLAALSEPVRAGLLLPPWRDAPEQFSQRRLSLRDRGWLVKDWLRHRADFPPFPNPHLRTNAFAVRREVLLGIEMGPLASKEDALRLESGRASLTRQVVGRGLKVLVVGRDGLAYAPDDWPDSATFRSGDQANLLVADNRTEDWSAAVPELRTRLAAMAWGERRAGAPGR